MNAKDKGQRLSMWRLSEDRKHVESSWQGIWAPLLPGEVVKALKEYEHDRTRLNALQQQLADALTYQTELAGRVYETEQQLADLKAERDRYRDKAALADALRNRLKTTTTWDELDFVINEYFIDPYDAIAPEEAQ